MKSVTVVKYNHLGEETWRYPGRILETHPDYIRLEAWFNGEEVSIHGLLFKKNDRFVETFYTNRWYNIFEIHDRDDDRLKGWYCNIGCPAVIEDNLISYIDLALDLLVLPDGSQFVLDEAEFEVLPVSSEDRRQARLALTELQERFHSRLNRSSGGSSGGLF